MSLQEWRSFSFEHSRLTNTLGMILQKWRSFSFELDWLTGTLCWWYSIRYQLLVECHCSRLIINCFLASGVHARARMERWGFRNPLRDWYWRRKVYRCIYCQALSSLSKLFFCLLYCIFLVHTFYSYLLLLLNESAAQLHGWIIHKWLVPCLRPVATSSTI